MSWWPVLIPARFPTLFCPSTLLFNQAAGVGSPRTYSAHSPQPWIALVSGSLVRYPMGLGSPAMQSRLCPGLSPGGWLGSQTRHSLCSLSLQLCCLSSCQPVTALISIHLGRHAFQPCQGRAGRIVSPVAGVISPSGLLPPLPVLCWSSGWGCPSCEINLLTIG